MSEDPVARDMALPLYNAICNVVGVGCDMAREAGVPPEVIAEFLRRLDEANEATISSPNARQVLGHDLAVLMTKFGRDPD